MPFICLLEALEILGRLVLDITTGKFMFLGDPSAVIPRFLCFWGPQGASRPSPQGHSDVHWWSILLLICGDSWAILRLCWTLVGASCLGLENPGPGPHPKSMPFLGSLGINIEGIPKGPHSLNAPQGRGWRILKKKPSCPFTFHAQRIAFDLISCKN